MTEPPSIIGATISHYTVLEKLGAGGMGIVYKAQDTRLGRFVALKFLPETIAHDPQAIERFRREARAASALNHPNICTIFDVGELEGRPFLAMELLEGHTLKHRIGKRSFSISELLDIGSQIASGLEAAHAKGIIHRDIKPGNIFLVQHGPAKILDFGLAKLAAYRQPEEDSTSEDSHRTHTHVLDDGFVTSTGTSVGTIAYMSPEQARGEKLDARSDLFSLGVVLYEMATGVRPFSGPTVALTFDELLHSMPVPASRVNLNVPSALENVLAKALEKDPSLRYQSASELQTDLRRLKRDTDASTSGILPAHSGATLAAREQKPRSSWRAWLPVAVVLLAIAGMVGFALSRPSSIPRVVRTVQLTNTNRPKSGVVTDGARLYFIQDTSVLMQTSVTGGESFPIPTSLEDTGFANVFDISQDGSMLLMNTAHGTALDGPLWSVPVLGGSPHRLAATEGHSGAWSADGKSLIYAKGNELFLAQSDGSSAKSLLNLSGTPNDLRWSPDGSSIRFTLSDPRTNNRSIWEVSSSGKEVHSLIPGWDTSPNECCGKWTRDGRYFLFQAQRDETADLWALDERSGLFHSGNKEPIQLTSGPMNVSNPVPSRDGKRIFVQGWSPRSEVVRWDATTGQFNPYLGGISAMGLDFSRDGKWVAYNDGSDGTMWRMKVDGTQKLQLVFAPMQAYLPRWSPDGTQIAFFAHPPGEPWHIYSIPAEGGTPELLYKNESNLADPTWSPDGKSLAFGQNSLNNQGSAIYVLDLQTRKATKLPGSEGLYSPRWSPDGRHLVAITLDSLKVMLFDFSTQQWTTLADIFVAYPNWSHDGRFIYFDGILNNQEGFYRVPVTGGKPERLFSMKGFPQAGGAFGIWTGLGPDESPLLARDASIQEIYAIEWDKY